MSTTIRLGPWGGSGGNSFDDGSDNGGVVKLTLYFGAQIVNGFEVVYGNGATQLHGQAIGGGIEIDTSSLAAIDVSVTVGANSAFSSDPDHKGVVALGFGTSKAPNSVPSGANGTVYRPQVVGFFGNAGHRVDRLGIYVSNV